MKFISFQKYLVTLFLFSVGFSPLAQEVLWEQTNGPITGTVTLIESSSAEGDIWCLANNRFYRSIDNGKSWSTTNLPNRDIATFTISENGSIYAASVSSTL